MLHGYCNVPTDKSISHRSLMLGAIACGDTYVSGLLESEDIFGTLNALKSMGTSIEKMQDGRYKITGVGLKGLKQPQKSINMGNAGTAMRLMAGILAGQNFPVTMTGDASLTSRPMQRIIDPLLQHGVNIKAETLEGFAPLHIHGSGYTKGGTFTLKIASAQVKSAILLAGLYADQPTIVIEPIATRDYTEKMLQQFGANIFVETLNNGQNKITMQPPQTLTACDITVPSDISSAAFPLVAACIVPDSDITIQNVGIHKARDGIIHSLKDLDADIQLINISQDISDIHIRYRPLQACDIDPLRAASQIDEYPALFIAAAFAHGKTTMTNLHELRVKESDRLIVMAEGLKKCGVPLEYGDDWISITGSSGAPLKGGAHIDTHLDHRIAMAFYIAALHAENPITINDFSPVETSFPGFLTLFDQLQTTK